MKLRIAVLLALCACVLGQTTAPLAETTAAPPPPAETTTAAPPPPTTQPSTALPPTTDTSTAPPNPSTITTPLASPTEPPTTQPPPPTTPTAAPTPKAVQGQWGLLSPDSTDYCVILQATMTFTVLYNKTDGQNGTAHFVLAEHANVSDFHCASDTETEQLFGLIWGNIEGSPEPQFNLTFTFRKDSATDNYTLDHLELDYIVQENDTIFPGATETFTPISLHSVNQSDDFWSEKTYAFKCLKGTIQMKENENSKIDYENFQFQAFDKRDAIDSYGNFIECAADFTTSDIVPIAVGCALAALVVIVLIAYLIGRKRSRQKGYQSV